AAEVQLLGPLLEAADALHRPQQLDLASRLDLPRHLDRPAARRAHAAPYLAHRHLVPLHTARDNAEGRKPGVYRARAPTPPRPDPGDDLDAGPTSRMRDQDVVKL